MDSFDSVYVEPFTERELTILHALIDGLSNKEIADRLYLATSTVKWYVRQINSKLATSNRDEIIERATQLGLLESSAPVAAQLHNLPAQTMPFVGRESELVELCLLLSEEATRLVNVLAPGGMGKTTLTLEAARRLLPSFVDGVYFVDLAALNSLDDQLLSSLSTFIDRLRAGYSLLQCFEDVATRAPEPTASIFRRVMADIHQGTPLPEALTRIHHQAGSSYFSQVIGAIISQLTEGGSLDDRLDTISQSLRARFGDSRLNTGSGTSRADYADHQITAAIAEAMDYQFQQDDRPPRQQLFDFLAGKDLLLLLDNFEHLLDGSALVTEILQAAPSVRILVTSRERLNLTGETVYNLRGMSLPTWESVEQAQQSDAARLLLQAARRMRPEFELTPDNLPHFIQICHLAEGMPLAILLAASWLDALTLPEIVAEIQKNVDFLETEMRDVPERQRSIRAVFESVWQRLEPAEQDVFARLSVFQGDCTREAAETICGATLRILHSLVSRSLLIHTRQGRYHLHQLLRQYAQMQLDEVQQAALRTAHMNYYMQLVYDQGQQFYSASNQQVMRTLEDELDNIRAARRWAIQTRDHDALDKAAEMMPVYDCRGMWHEALDVFTKALDIVGRDARTLTAARIRQLIVLCAYRLRRQNLEAFTEETVRIFDELQEHRESFVARDMLANYAIDRGDFATARTITEQRLAMARQQDHHLGVYHALQTMGIISISEGDPARGERELLESTRIAHLRGDTYAAAFNLHNLADAVFYQGDVARAQALYEESHDLARELNIIPLIHVNLLYLARLVYNQGEYDTAGRLLAEAREFENEIGENQIGKWGLLSLIAFQAGDYAQACEHLCTAFSEEGLYLQLHSHFRLPLVEAVVNLLVYTGRLVDAVHWLAFNEHHPTHDLLARNRLQTLAEKIEQALDAEVYAAAWERGQQIDAETLVEEFVAPVCLGRVLP